MSGLSWFCLPGVRPGLAWAARGLAWTARRLAWPDSSGLSFQVSGPDCPARYVVWHVLACQGSGLAGLYGQSSCLTSLDCQMPGLPVVLPGLLGFRRCLP